MFVPKEQRRLVAYIRVSTKAQTDNYSLDSQKSKIEEFAKTRGYELVACYQDQESGTKWSRSGFDAAMKHVFEGDADGFIVWSLDRFIRKALKGWSIVSDLEAAGKHLVVVNRGLDTAQGGPTGKLVFQILLAVAEYELSIIQERFDAGRAEKKAAGGHYAGQSRFGWKAVSGRLVEVESEQWTLKVCSRLHSLGVPYAEVARYLNRNIHRHATKRGGFWSHRSVQRIITGGRYVSENGYEEAV